jgi:hydroxymethylpyrimidine pyrophosphatase-like HAD family hydrolase
MSKEPIVFADLDDTLFQSARKVPHDETKDLRLVSEAVSGNHSYQTLKQQALFDWLINTTLLIPVTARSTRSFGNVRLPFRPLWAVLGNGAVIYKNGSVDTEWHDMLLAETTKETDAIAQLEDACKSIAGELGIAVRCPASVENGIRHSVIVKQDDPDVSIRLNEILERVSVPEGWTSHLNSNNLAFTVPSVSKKRAVEYVISQISGVNERIVFGMGDSLTDMPFMNLCDFFATPTRGQIADTFGFKK